MDLGSTINYIHLTPELFLMTASLRKSVKTDQKTLSGAILN